MDTVLEARANVTAALRRNGFDCTQQNNSAASGVYLGRSSHRHVSPAPHRWSFYASLVHAKFVASPAGYGRDCYRTWEAFALGTVPVMRAVDGSELERQKYVSLPVVWVRDWSEVTPKLLEERWLALRQRSFNARRAFFPYWLGRLTSESALALEASRDHSFDHPSAGAERRSADL